MSLFPEVDEEIEEIKNNEKLALKNIIDSSEKWRPSNGTEGFIFEDNFCEECSKNNGELDIWCETLGELLGGYSESIRLFEEEVVCLKNSNFNIRDYVDGNNE